MNILVIGGGGREHALCHVLRKSRNTEKLYSSPGNAGIAEVAECVNLDAENHAAIEKFAKEKNIGLVVVGPEVPLVAGLASYLEEKGVKVFGPSRKAAELEGSKAFMKDICKKYNIPTAFYRNFTHKEKAKKFIDEFNGRVVVKASGLAAGKGVIIPENKEEAKKAVDDIMGGMFGSSGDEIVIEEFMEGEEASFFALCDGKIAIQLGSAQDHKRAFDGDKGPNTGGMGSYSPAPVMTAGIDREVMEKIILPTMQGMEKEGRPYKGVLFAGLMITSAGPKLIEYNVRFGDPETQSLMLRLESDLVELMLASAEGNLAGKKVNLKSDAAVSIVMAAKGYPGDYKKGSEIKNLEQAAQQKDALIFHAGTKRDGDKIVANGGRVLSVCATGKTIAEARENAYRAVGVIEWPEGFYRKDIGHRALAKEGEK